MKTDVVVLGGGNGGYAAALRATYLGLSVTLVERSKVGGTCLHLGCVPTKAILHSADLMETFRKSKSFGILTEPPIVEWPGVMSYKDSVVSKHFKGLSGLIKSRGIDLVNGSGRLSSPHSVDVEGGETIEADAVVLATGSYARSLPFIEIDGKAFITSDHALALDALPESVIVVGAGAVGLEFASAFAAFGADVTIVEALSRLAPGEDEEVSAELQRQFRKRGIRSVVGAKVTEGRRTETGAALIVEIDGKVETIEAQKCLIAVGRGPVSDGLGYEQAGVKLERGFVVTDEYCRTGVEGVWAVGDLITQPSLNLPFPHFQLAHVAFAEGIGVAEQIAGMGPVGGCVDYVGVPRATYSAPEIASVGLTEKQAIQAGYDVKTSKLNWAGFAKASILGEHGGFVKVVAADQGQVLGVHMIGPRVTELIAEAQLITNWEAYPSEVAGLIHPHPTLSEALGESMMALAGKPLHG
jgi:dihydrolipoamide dehydrogenase